jgi:vacuolar-type H+-ATPase subunit I/STV1
LDDDKWDVTIHRYMSDLPIEVDDVQYSKISMQVAGLEAKVAELSELAKATKGKEAKEAINSDIKNYKAELKELNKVIKEKSKLQDAEIANIDEFVYKESKARFNELRMIYHSMKEAAIDCKILSKFHDDVSIICGRLPARASSPTSSDSP